MTPPRSALEDVLGAAITRELWTRNYEKALPLSLLDVDLSAVLPAVFYSFRFGVRRGRGKFLEVFGGESPSLKERRAGATIEKVAAKLAERTEWFCGFEGDAERAILGDLLLAFCLENKQRALGRREQVQRILPTHTMASWVDLPERVAHLRYVPEMLVALLANQKEGERIRQTAGNERTWFAVGRGFEHNLLLRAFGRGMSVKGVLGDLAGDEFDERAEVALDQLLTIRLAQMLGHAPEKNRGDGGPEIVNQQPIAERAARHFSEDIRRFLLAYSDVLPRHVLVELLESCMAVGLTTVLGSVVEVMLHWAATGEVPSKDRELPPPRFVDCSCGVDSELRVSAEVSFADFLRRAERLPVVFALARFLDLGVRHDPKLRKVQLPTKPSARQWLDFLGDVLYERHPDSHPLHDYFARKASELAEQLRDEYSEAAKVLDAEQAQPNVFWRLAEALVMLLGRKNTFHGLYLLIDSLAHVDRPNGLAAKRQVTRKLYGSATARKQVARSLVLTDAVLDYLVHLHALPASVGSQQHVLSLKDFLNILRLRYGFYVDTAPPGSDLSSELLRRNRAVLERRLRDLGLLVGVNDAESMKHLRARFPLGKHWVARDAS